MKIAVLAAGAVGGYFGARLANAGHDVHFIARGANLEALRRNGLRIESALGDLHLPQVSATSDPAQIGPVDIVLFAVKLWDTESVGEFAKPLLGPQTRLISNQNGVDSVERLAPIIGADRVAAGVTYIASVIKEPGVISHTSQFARMRIGRLDGTADKTLADFVAAAQTAGTDIAMSEDIRVERWKKFASLVTMSAATASMRLPIGPIRADAETLAFCLTIMREVIAVAQAKGIPLPTEFIHEGEKFLQAAPEGMKASMTHDLERGNRMELDWLSGKVVELGREVGVPTPANAAVYAMLKLHRLGRRAA